MRAGVITSGGWYVQHVAAQRPRNQERHKSAPAIQHETDVSASAVPRGSAIVPLKRRAGVASA